MNIIFAILNNWVTRVIRNSLKFSAEEPVKCLCFSKYIYNKIYLVFLQIWTSVSFAGCEQLPYSVHPWFLILGRCFHILVVSGDEVEFLAVSKETLFSQGGGMLNCKSVGVWLRKDSCFTEVKCNIGWENKSHNGPKSLRETCSTVALKEAS